MERKKKRERSGLQVERGRLAERKKKRNSKGGLSWSFSGVKLREVKNRTWTAEALEIWRQNKT